MVFAIIMAHAKMTFDNNLRGYFVVAGADMMRNFCKGKIFYFESALVDGPTQVDIFVE